MKNDYEIMEALKASMVEHLAEYYGTMAGAESLLSPITADNIVIDSPDPDNMPKKDTFWLEFDNGTSEEESTLTDVAAMGILVHIMCSKDDQQILQKRCWGYHSALYRFLRNNQGLDGAVDISMITDWEWYPQVTAKPGTCCIVCTVSLQWHKDWS